MVVRLGTSVFDMSGVGIVDVMDVNGLCSSALVLCSWVVGIPLIGVDGGLVSDVCSYRSSVIVVQCIRVLAVMARLVVGMNILCLVEHLRVRYPVRMRAVLQMETYPICRLVGRVDKWVKLMVCWLNDVG